MSRITLPLFSGALLGWLLTATTALAQSGPLYSQGDPSPQEQFVLELVNRARANPPAEGVRLGRAADFAGYSARPPLALHTALSAAARGHDNDMAANNFVSHSGSDGSQPGDRAVAAGYPGAPSSVGENVSYGFTNIQQGFDALMLDDGVPGLEHRKNYLDLYFSANFYRETGLALDLDTRALNTQMFATRGVGLVTGVAFRDGNGDNFYTPGEGVSGVTVTSPQSNFTTATSASGGYSLPLDNVHDLSAGATVVFRDPASGATYTRRFGLSASPVDGAPDNVKNDLRVGVDAPDALVAAASTVSVVGTPARGGFVVSRAGSTAAALTVVYHNGGSAGRDVDYVAFPGTLTFAAGQSEAIIPVTLLPGANRNRKVKVFLDPAPDGASYAIGKAQSKVYLSDLP